MYLKTNQFHASQFDYLLSRLKGIQEGDGTLLDHSLLMFCSNLFDGDRHQAERRNGDRYSSSFYLPSVLGTSSPVRFGRNRGKRGSALRFILRAGRSWRRCFSWLPP